MKIVLIPTDFSAPSLETIQHAFAFLQTIGTNYRLLLLHTYLVPHVSPDQFITRHDELKKKAVDQLEGIRHTLENLKTVKKIPITIMAHMGTLENVIHHLVEEHQVDCIAMGAKNNRVPVLHHIECPVLLIPHQAQ